LKPDVRGPPSSIARDVQPRFDVRPAAKLSDFHMQHARIDLLTRHDLLFLIRVADALAIDEQRVPLTILRSLRGQEKRKEGREN
jgi:hypothetical protein